MPTSKSQLRAIRKHEAKAYDKLTIRLPKGTREKIEATGESLNGFISKAVTEKLNKET